MDDDNSAASAAAAAAAAVVTGAAVHAHGSPWLQAKVLEKQLVKAGASSESARMKPRAFYQQQV